MSPPRMPNATIPAEILPMPGPTNRLLQALPMIAQLSCAFSCTPQSLPSTREDLSASPAASGSKSTSRSSAKVAPVAASETDTVSNIDPSSCGLPHELQKPDWPRRLPSTAPAPRVPWSKDEWTFAVLPDTQYYSSCREPHMATQTRFVAEFAQQRSLLATLFLGDLTEHNTAAEWDYVNEALAFLPKQYPTIVASGNHDYGDNGSANVRTSLFDTHLSAPSPSTREVTLATMKSGSWENAYYRLPWNEQKLGILVLEWSPRNKTVEWAKSILSKYPKDRVIFITHAYMYHDDTRYDWTGKGDAQEWNPLVYGTAKRDPLAPPGEDNRHPEGAHDGEMLYQQLLHSHPGVFLTLSGHVLADGTGLLSSAAEHGNVVHQMLVNYQMLDEGGLAYLRLLSINGDGTQLTARTYSPALGTYATASDQDFVLSIVPPLGAKRR